MMKTYIGKRFLQMATIWIILSSCLPVCCDSKNSKLPLAPIPLEKPTNRTTVEWSEADRKSLQIIGQYPGLIEQIQSTINTLSSESKQAIPEILTTIEGTYSSFSKALTQATKLQEAKNMQDNLSNMIEKIAQLDQDQHILELQKLLQKIDTLFEQFINALQDTPGPEEAQRNNTISVVVDKM